jgi:putative drug exporter of the RND superfamily
VAFGVLLDTFVVRSLLVPALSYDIGRVIWWPSKLWRRRDDESTRAAAAATLEASAGDVVEESHVPAHRA